VHISTEANARNSPLLRLPRELRNQIYDEILYGTSIKVHKPSHSLASKLKRFLRKLALLQGDASSAFLTCKQIRYEAFALLVRLVAFNFSTDYSAVTLSHQLPLKYMGSRICHWLTSIVLHEKMIDDLVAADLPLGYTEQVPSPQTAFYFYNVETVWALSDKWAGDTSAVVFAVAAFFNVDVTVLVVVEVMIEEELWHEVGAVTVQVQ